MDSITLNNKIQLIPASEEPFLSADVAFIHAENATVIFDVGRIDDVFEAIETVDGNRIFVISHFHQDHMYNLSRIRFRDGDMVYCSSLTAKKAGAYLPADKIITVTEPIDFSADITVFPIPSSHEKGCLGLKVGDIAFTGDATYSTKKDGHVTFNTSLLHQTIEVLKNCPAEFLYQSHSAELSEKNKVLKGLEHIYAHRVPGEAYIVVKF